MQGESILEVMESVLVSVFAGGDDILLVPSLLGFVELDIELGTAEVELGFVVPLGSALVVVSAGVLCSTADDGGTLDEVVSGSAEVVGGGEGAAACDVVVTLSARFGSAGANWALLIRSMPLPDSGIESSDAKRPWIVPRAHICAPRPVLPSKWPVYHLSPQAVPVVPPEQDLAAASEDGIR